MSPFPDGDWLNLGSGRASAAGWIHIDGSWQTRFSRMPLLAWIGVKLTGRDLGAWPPEVRYCDFRRGLPFRSETVAVAYASHLLEHLYREQALFLLGEVRRVLKPGGVCRVVVPDVAAIVQWYLEYRQITPRPRKPASDVLMEMLALRGPSGPSRGLLGLYRSWTGFDEHKWMYDEEGLIALLQEAGFTHATARRFLESDIPAERLSAVEESSRTENGAGVCAEARK